MARSKLETRGPMIEALKRLPLGRRPVIIDAGMGAGCLGECIRREFPHAELTGADCWLRYLVDPACRQTDGWPSLSLYDTLIGGSEARLPGYLERLPNASYDAIVLGDVLEHLDPHTAVACLKRALAVARLGVVVNTPIVEFPQKALWNNDAERHKFTWPRERWEELGGEFIGGGSGVATFLFRSYPTVQPALSVVIPAFNRKAYVDLCVRSLLRTETPRWKFEIIVVDDGSIDGTDEHLRREFGDLNVTCVRRTVNIGKPNCPGLARNVGLRAARGMVVAFLDCDIVHCRDPITAQLAVTGNAVWRCHGMWMLEAHVEATGGTTFRSGADDLIPAQMWWAVNRELLVSIGGYDERFTVYGAEDFDILARLGRHGRPTKHVPRQYAIGLYAPRNAGPRNVIDVAQNERQHKLWRADCSIIRNEEIEWGKQHAD